MEVQNIIVDRAFDCACVSVADREWSQTIYDKLTNKYPEYTNWINGLIKLYKSHLSNNADYCTYRRDYMLNHKDTIKLRYK